MLYHGSKYLWMFTFLFSSQSLQQILSNSEINDCWDETDDL